MWCIFMIAGVYASCNLGCKDSDVSIYVAF